MQKATRRGGFCGRNGSRRALSSAYVRRAAAVNCYVKWNLMYCESLKNFGGLAGWPQASNNTRSLWPTGLQVKRCRVFHKVPTTFRPLRPLAYGSASGSCRPVSGPLAAEGLEWPLPDRRYIRTRPEAVSSQRVLLRNFFAAYIRWSATSRSLSGSLPSLGIRAAPMLACN